MSELIKKITDSGSHMVQLPIVPISEQGLFVYRVETEFKGSVHTYTPRIPENRLTHEDATTPRICCALTVYGALLASTAVYDLYRKFQVSNVPDCIGSIYIYRANVKPENLIQCEQLVPDADYTGELWINTPTRFEFIEEALLYEKYRLPRCAFTMYALKPVGLPISQNMQFTYGLQAVEGSITGGMHFIMRDPSREQEASYWISHFTNSTDQLMWLPNDDEHDWREDPWNK